MKKQSLEGLEGKALDLATAFNSAVDKIGELDQKSASFGALQTEMATLKENAKGTELEAKMEQLSRDFTERANAIEAKMVSGAGGKKDEFITPANAFLNLLESKGVKTFADLAKFADDFKQGIEVKADPILTSDYTGTISRTQEVSPVKFAPVRPFAFMPYVRNGNVSNGKSLIMWTPGSYTSNVGYAGESTNTVSENQASAIEKTRQMAKISAKQYMSAETFEDLPQFAQRLQEKMYSESQLFVDEKILNGAGNDATKPREIYGIIGEGSTAFEPTDAASVFKPNISDLVDACATQALIAKYVVNTVWMSPKTANKLRRTKDSDGQYIVNKLITGEDVLGGLKVITNQLIGDDELVVGNASLIQLWTKRTLNIRIGQFGKEDIEADTFTAILFYRAQVLVEDEDKKGIIYVSSIAAALAGIEEVAA
jgi:HK97 family phage major capsid protein